MMDAQLIFVEGTCGSGKSRTSQLIQLCLQHAGHTAEWIAEDQADHPLKRGAGSDPLHDSHNLRAQLIANWETLLERTDASETILVMDGALMHMAAGWLMLCGLSPGEIVLTVTRLAEMSRQAKPVVVYLRPADVPKAVHSVVSERGSDWLTERIAYFADTPYGAAHKVDDISGFAEFFVRLTETTDQIFSSLDLPKLRIENPAQSWPMTYSRISEFLNLKVLCLPPETVETLTPYLGHYRESVSGHEWIIETDGCSLLLADEPPRRLLRRQVDVFWVEGFPASLSFNRREGGGVERLVCVDQSAEASDPTTWNKVVV